MSQSDLDSYLKQWDLVASALASDPENPELLAQRTKIEHFIDATRFLMGQGPAPEDPAPEGPAPVVNVEDPAALEATSGLTSAISGAASATFGEANTSQQEEPSGSGFKAVSTGWVICIWTILEGCFEVTG